MRRLEWAMEQAALLEAIREADGEGFAAEVAPAPAPDWFTIAVDICAEPMRQRPTTLDDLLDALA